MPKTLSNPTLSFHPHTIPLPLGGNAEVGKLISDAMAKVGRQGVVTMEESKTAEDSLFFVEGMQFDRGYYSPYFVTDPERMVSGEEVWNAWRGDVCRGQPVPWEVQAVCLRVLLLHPAGFCLIN